MDRNRFEDRKFVSGINSSTEISLRMDKLDVEILDDKKFE